MSVKYLVFAALVFQLSGCVVTPRISFNEEIKFDNYAPSMQGLSYNDYLCCDKCTA